MTLKSFVSHWLTVIVVGLGGWVDGAAATSPPNVVVVLSDDQGWGDLSLNGNRDLSTPRIDQLARSGASVDRFYVCPVCAPTRAEFFTGRYFARTGVRGVSLGQERLNLDETTIAQIFKSAGYATGAFGKWHNGTQHPYHPNARGFDEFYGFCSGHWGQYFDPELDHNGEMVRGKGFIIDDLAEHAMEFLEKNRQRPFFCYVPFNSPHSPMQVPDRFWEKFAKAPITQRSSNPAKEELDHSRAALAMCENLDWNVGRILDKLEALGLAENTIVLYFSDNGPNGWRWNGGMKGKKGSLDEGGVRVPFLIRWPGQIPAGIRVPQIAGSIDLLPTLADLAGVPLPKTKPLDGRSLKPLLTASNPASVPWTDRALISAQYGAKKPRLSLRDQRFHLDEAGALYDLVADPGQTQDVRADHPAEALQLQAQADTFLKEVSREEADNRPYTVGFSPTTPLPARDGVPHGTVRRSASAPNCSYFTHWTSPEDRLTWEIEVGQEGDYEAVIYYTCAAENVGTELELSFRDQAVRTRVSAPNDPPAVGAAEDRSPRAGESYVKDFKPLSLGKIRLGAGRGELSLRAPLIPGKESVELRYVMLKRLAK